MSQTQASYQSTAALSSIVTNIIISNLTRGDISNVNMRTTKTLKKNLNENINIIMSSFVGDDDSSLDSI